MSVEHMVPPIGIEPIPDDYKSTARPSCYGGTCLNYTQGTVNNDKARLEFCELDELRHLVRLHEQTIADMLRTQHPIMRDALRYQTLRESQFDAVVVILTSAGGHMAEPDQIDCEVDRMIEAKSGLKLAA